MKKYDDNELRGLVADGLTTGEIGEQFGVGASAIRSALRRRDIDRPGRVQLMRGIREKAEAMKPVEAVNYLLECLELMNGALCDPSQSHPVDDFVTFPVGQRALLIALWDANGEIVTRKSLMDAYCFGRITDPPADKIIDVQLCKMRKKLPENFGKIENVWGRGYRLVREC